MVTLSQWTRCTSRVCAKYETLLLKTLRSIFIASDFISHESWFSRAFAYLLMMIVWSSTHHEACFLITILLCSNNVYKIVRRIWYRDNLSSFLYGMRVGIFFHIEWHGQAFTSRDVQFCRGNAIVLHQAGANTIACFRSVQSQWISIAFQVYGIADLVTSTSSLSKSTSLLIAVIVSLCSKYSRILLQFRDLLQQIVHSYTSNSTHLFTWTSFDKELRDNTWFKISWEV